MFAEADPACREVVRPANGWWSKSADARPHYLRPRSPMHVCRDRSVASPSARTECRARVLSQQMQSSARHLSSDARTTGALLVNSFVLPRRSRPSEGRHMSSEIIFLRRRSPQAVRTLTRSFARIALLPAYYSSPLGHHYSRLRISKNIG